MKKITKLRFFDTYKDCIALYPDCDYYIIYSERSNGKTYSALYYALDEYYKNNRACAYIRRWYDDIKSDKGASLLKNLLHDKRIEEITHNKYNGVVYKNKCYYLAKYDGDGNLIEQDKNECIHLFSLSEEEHYKSTAFPQIKTIIFDEFIARGYEMQNEFIIFSNLLSTIIRLKDDVKVIMLANSINLYRTTYFKNMGINHVKDQKINTIDLYENAKSGLKMAVMYGSFVDKKGNRQKKPSDKYFSFDNPQLKMITEGKWELRVYPPLETKYSDKDIKLMYFIEYDNNILQCEVIYTNQKAFTYIHRKTTPIQPKQNLVYSLAYSDNPFHRRNIGKPQTKLENKILWFFKVDLVRYQDNEVGEIVSAYLRDCNFRL